MIAIAHEAPSREHTLDINDELPDVLAQRTITVSGKEFQLELGTAKYTLTDAYDTVVGTKSFPQIYVTNPRVGNRYAVETIAGPLSFDALSDHEPQLERERAGLQYIGSKATAKVINGVQRDGRIVQPLIGAYDRRQPSRVLEQTAPGVTLNQAHEILEFAYYQGYLSLEQCQAADRHFYESCRNALAQAHEAKIIHGHAHRRNFVIDLTTGSACLIDLTLARTPKLKRDLAALNDWSGWIQNSPAEDVERLDESWHSDRDTSSDVFFGEVNSSEHHKNLAIALPQLQAINYAMTFASMGLGRVDLEDITQVLAARRDLIADAPSIQYNPEVQNGRIGIFSLVMNSLNRMRQARQA